MVGVNKGRFGQGRPPIAFWPRWKGYTPIPWKEICWWDYWVGGACWTAAGAPITTSNHQNVFNHSHLHPHSLPLSTKTKVFILGRVDAQPQRTLLGTVATRSPQPSTQGQLRGADPEFVGRHPRWFGRIRLQHAERQPCVARCQRAKRQDGPADAASTERR